MTTITVNKSRLVNAIYNYLQSGRYGVDFESSGRPSKDDQQIADSINLKELSREQIAEVVADEYYEKLSDLQDVTVKGITKAMSIPLCGAWISMQPNIKGNYFQVGDGDLWMGEATVYLIS